MTATNETEQDQVVFWQSIVIALVNKLTPGAVSINFEDFAERTSYLTLDTTPTGLAIEVVDKAKFERWQRSTAARRLAS